MYRLSWLEHWSEKHPALSPGVYVEHREESDGWFEHDYSYRFRAESDTEAKAIALRFIEKNPEGSPFEVWSLYNENPILTEEGEEYV